MCARVRVRLCAFRFPFHLIVPLFFFPLFFRSSSCQERIPTFLMKPSGFSTFLSPSPILRTDTCAR